MVILGIDPGTQRVGFGAIETRERQQPALLAVGVLTVTTRSAAENLKEIRRGIEALIIQWKPSVLAVETLYFSKNQKTALSVAQARGVILLSGVEHGIEIREYAPNEAKAALTGYGHADKKAVAKMVRFALGAPSLRMLDDATDALALALVASGEKRLDKGRF